MSGSDKVAAKIAGYRAKVEARAMPDTYELVAPVSVADGEGGTTVTETVVESGPCRLTAGGTRPEELALGARQGAQAPYTIEVPYATGATERRTIRVRGRMFEIVGVPLREGAWGLTVRLNCEERS